MEVNSDLRTSENKLMNHSPRRSSPGEGEYYSATSTEMEEPISYACMTKKERTERPFNLSEDVYMEHAIDLKIDPSSPVDRPFNISEDVYMDHAIDLKIDPSSPVDSADLSVDLSTSADMASNFNNVSTGVGSNASTVSSGDLNAGNLTLWRFLLDLLLSGRHQEIIQWTNGRGEFMLLQAEEVARLWGLRKNKNHRMTYDKLSRALRYYYQKNIIQKVHGHKFVYRFVNLPDGVLHTCRMSMNQEKVPYDLSMAATNGGTHNSFRSSLSGPLALLGDRSLSPRSLIARCHAADRLSIEAAMDERRHCVAIKTERHDSPHLSSPGMEANCQPSPPSLSRPPGLVSSASSSSSLASAGEEAPPRHCRCHPHCRQLLPERRSVACQTTNDLPCLLPPGLPGFLTPQPAPASVASSASPPAPHRPPPAPSPAPARAAEERPSGHEASGHGPSTGGGLRTLQKGLHSLNMQKFAQCIQLQTVPTAREMMSKLLPSPRSVHSTSSNSGRHQRHHAATPYAKQYSTGSANGHHRQRQSSWRSEQQRARSVSPAGGVSASGLDLAGFPTFPGPPPLFPANPSAGAAVPGLVPPTTSSASATSPSSGPASSSSSSSFVWVPVHVNMLRLRQQMSAAAAAAAAATSPSTHAASALKHFAFPTGGQ